LLALSQGLVTYLAAWVVMGLGMGAGLYDAAFAALGRCYGERARRAITALTLFGGFASTVGWPLSAWLTESLGWRGACAVYAALQLALALPVYLTVLPREERRPQGSSRAEAAAGGSPAPPGPVRRRTVLALLASAFTLGDVIWSVLSVHVIIILRARGVPLAEAVALGALVGPSQVAARAVEMLTGRHYHPIWTMGASVALVAGGIMLLLLGFPVLALALALYGAGNGIGSIAKGTLPLSLFGPDGYATLMGKLAMPSLLAQALSPSLGAILIEWSGSGAALGFLAGMTCLNIVLVGLLWVVARRG
jgi:MFS family permease